MQSPSLEKTDGFRVVYKGRGATSKKEITVVIESGKPGSGINFSVLDEASTNARLKEEGEGAEKISVNSPALADPELISRLTARFGSQCVVVGIDSQTLEGDYQVYQFTGDPQRTRNTARRTLDWVREVQERGAGEIVLNCMASDGVRQGYDIAQLCAVRERCQVPLIASGGAGTPQHFAEVFQRAHVDGALAASVFHTGAIAIPDLKRFLRAQPIEIRP
jgi:cyclase